MQNWLMDRIYFAHLKSKQSWSPGVKEKLYFAARDETWTIFDDEQWNIKKNHQFFCSPMKKIHFDRLLPSSVPVGNCSCNWTEIAI